MYSVKSHRHIGVEILGGHCSLPVISPWFSWWPLIGAAGGAAEGGRILAFSPWQRDGNGVTLAYALPCAALSTPRPEPIESPKPLAAAPNHPNLLISQCLLAILRKQSARHQFCGG
jgi:hypothetical protein